VPDLEDYAKQEEANSGFGCDEVEDTDTLSDDLKFVGLDVILRWDFCTSTSESVSCRDCDSTRVGCKQGLIVSVSPYSRTQEAIELTQVATSIASSHPRLC
jgi:hypothetical protein